MGVLGGEGVPRATQPRGVSCSWAVISTHPTVCKEAETGVGILSVSLAVAGGSHRTGQLGALELLSSAVFPRRGFALQALHDVCRDLILTAAPRPPLLCRDRRACRGDAAPLAPGACR